LADALASWRRGPRFRYIDLGSGGGFPGLVWHDVFAQDPRLTPVFMGTDLVEPRTKRAWFLEQASRAMGLDHIEVVEESWTPAVSSCSEFGEPELTLISMKALHLTDEQVLAGLSSYAVHLSGSDVVIARFVSGWSGDPLWGDPPVPELPWDPQAEEQGAAHWALPYPSRRPDSVLLLSIYPSA
jgi:rRNA small subunit methyltransferase G